MAERISGRMRIVCSWCRREGKIAVIGEKPPYEDQRETHGICVPHRLAVQKRWKAEVKLAPWTAALEFWQTWVKPNRKDGRSS